MENHTTFQSASYLSDKKLIWLCIFAMFAAPLFGSEADYVPGEVLVQFEPKDNGELRSIEEKTETLSSLGGGTIVRSYKLVPGLSLVKLPQETSVEAALVTFSASAEVAHVQPNYIYHAFSNFPNDPCFLKLWGLHNTGQTGGTPDADIDAPQAWDIATDSNVIVAVIDSGVDYTHPDLAANMWTDSNGYHGYDFVNNDNDPLDDYGHGTHCAGIIGAVGNNALGVTGVCWNVRIMALKFMDGLGNGSTADAISCIDYAVEKGAKVLSNSWGWYNYDEDLEVEIEVANAAGVLFVAAAGNSGYNNDSHPAYPASYTCNNIISVMATDHNDRRSIWPPWESSNYGLTTVDLAAPGSDILSCVPIYYGYYYYSSGGTSMAAPYVAGACALVWSRNQSLSHLQVKEIIMNSVDVVPDLNDNPQYGKMCVTGGRLNLFNTLTNTPTLTLDKVDNIDDGNGVVPGDYIMYTISYANPITDPCDPKYLGTLTNVNIIDYLPDDLVFSSASGPNSVYHPIAHTVTWSIGTLSPNESGFVTLTVKVNDCITGCGIITNLCEAESDSAYNTAEANTPVSSASNPRPACGEIVDLGVGEFNLTWCPGLFAAAHEVYFGSNYNEVNDADVNDVNIYKDTVNNPSYSLPFSDLDADTTYYWRIDEVNTAHPDGRWRGGVWSFTTGIYKIVDDFESYETLATLQAVWKNDDSSQAVVALVTDPCYVHGGSQSMQLRYRNQTSPYYSEAYADTTGTNSLPSGIGSDWAADGAELLSLDFKGRTSNDPNEPLYVKLTDGNSPAHTAKVLYDGAPTDLKDGSWHEWNITLQKFVDNNNVNLANVQKIAIGLGDKLAPTSQTKNAFLFFDDIRLYTRRCIPGLYPVSDFDSDCDVDFYDFAFFALAWLTNPGQPNYNSRYDISVPSDGKINVHDLALFCDDWLWQQDGDTQQQMMESQQSRDRQGAVIPEPQPQPQYEPHHTTQELIDWLEGVLADEQIRQTPTEDSVRKMIESLKEEL